MSSLNKDFHFNKGKDFISVIGPEQIDGIKTIFVLVLLKNVNTIFFVYFMQAVTKM